MILLMLCFGLMNMGVVAMDQDSLTLFVENFHQGPRSFTPQDKILTHELHCQEDKCNSNKIENKFLLPTYVQTVRPYYVLIMYMHLLT